MKENVVALLVPMLAEQGWTLPEEVSIGVPPAGIAHDVATNIALLLARQAQTSPRAVAEKLKETLERHPDIQAVEIAGPGFINLTFAPAWYGRILQALRPEDPIGSDKGSCSVEYISANPTGPVHIGNARGGPLGETLARVFTKLGYQVSREFYINDIGGQANKFASSVLYHYRRHYGQEATFPEGGYPGAYIEEIAGEVVRRYGEEILSHREPEQVEAMRGKAIQVMVESIRHTTERMGIHFDVWYPQSQLQASGLSAQTLATLTERGAVFEKEGAKWLKSGVLEDDRETVLVKSDGTPTYFLDDIAYHLDKLVTRNQETAFVVLGPGHHAHIPRMQAGLAALGLRPEQYQGIVYQHVQLKRDGVTVKMAKREGNFVTADEVLDLVPRDVFTYFMVSKNNDSHLDFDLALAQDTSEKNPVYYIQYAYARISSVLAKAPADWKAHVETSAWDLSEPARQLLMWLVSYQDVVREVGEHFRVNQLATYAYELATKYHKWYASERIITDDPVLTAERLQLCELSARTLKDVLGLLNVSAPERM